MRSLLVIVFLVLGATCIGCNTHPEEAGPAEAGNGSQPNGHANEVAQTNEEEPTAGEPTGWPAGDNPAESFNELVQEIESTFESFYLVEETQFYPIGFSKFKRVIDEIDTNVDEKADPMTGTVKIVYTKHFTLLHKSHEDAEQDMEMYPANPVQTKEVMLGRLNPKQNPITMDLTYTLENDRWVRTGLKIEPKYKDSSDVPGQMKLP